MEDRECDLPNPYRDYTEFDESTDDSSDRPTSKYKTPLILGGFATAAIVAAPNVKEVASTLADNAHWVVPSLVVTESMWNVGAAMMLASAGKRIGNPLTLHRRFKDVVSNSVDSKLFKSGLAINVLGEIGTASVVVGGSVAYLPPSAWPLTMGASAALAAPGIVVWSMVNKRRIAMKNYEDT